MAIHLYDCILNDNMHRPFYRFYFYICSGADAEQALNDLFSFHRNCSLIPFETLGDDFEGANGAIQYMCTYGCFHDSETQFWNLNSIDRIDIMHTFDNAYMHQKRNEAIEIKTEDIKIKTKEKSCSTK
jgi:hypothetical protein